MAKYKDKHGTSRVGDWLRKAKGVFPDIAEGAVEGLKTGNPLSVVGHVVNKLKEKGKEDEQAAILLREYEMKKLEFDREIFGDEVEDRKSAREMYMVDNSVQKVLSYTFVGGYFLVLIALCVFLYILSKDGQPLNNGVVAIVTSIMTALGEKVWKILSFHFGGSFARSSE